MINKKLVFHFYLNEEWENNFANGVHFKCLEHYSHIFDEALIVIATDIADVGIINAAKKRFVECIKSKVLTFKVVDNDGYYEGGTFKREIIDRLSEYEGLVFFGHNKGVACLSTKGGYDEDSLAVWITLMYFYNLEFVDDVEHKLLVDTVRTIYGALLMYADWFESASHTFFSGTFYWLNPGRVIKWAKKIPKMFDREYAEWFPGEVFGSDITYYLASRCELILSDVELYYGARDAEYICGKNDDDRKRYKEFFKEIMGYYE